MKLDFSFIKKNSSEKGHEQILQLCIHKLVPAATMTVVLVAQKIFLNWGNHQVARHCKQAGV